jgi:hypothetical protein
MWYYLSVLTAIGIGLCLFMLFYHIVRAIHSTHIHAMGKRAAKQTSDRIRDISKAGWQDDDIKMMLTSGAFLGHLNMISWLAQLHRGKFSSPEEALAAYRTVSNLDTTTLDQVHAKLDIRQKDFKDDMFHATCMLMKLMHSDKTK